MSRSWLLPLLAACSPDGGSSTTPSGLPDQVETLMRATYQQVDPTDGLSTTRSWTFGGGFSREGDAYDDTTERISYASVVTCTEDGDEITLDSSATFYAVP